MTVNASAPSVTVAASGSSDSATVRYVTAPLPDCWASPATASALVSDHSSECFATTNFSIGNVSAPVRIDEAMEICASSSCQRLYASLNDTSDCYLNRQNVSLYADVLDQLSPFCTNATNATSGSYAGSGLGSNAYHDDAVGAAYNPTKTSLPPAIETRVVEHSNATEIVTIVSIAVGAVLAFIAVVIAVVWYKRQSLRDLRYHAYLDPIVEAKPRLWSGIFNANFARRLRDRLSGGSRTHTQSSEASSEIQPVPLRSLAPTFHGDTLWSDQELLARHMRAEDIEDIRVIGNGAHGVVYLVRHRGSRLLASKRLVQDHITREKTRLLIAEIKLVATLEHPCIVQFVGAAWTTELDLQALFEYMPNGDLCTHLAKTSQPDERETWDLGKVQIAMDIAEALVYVHSFTPPLVHRDLKSRNVLLDENMRAKLTDFGVSRFHSTSNTMTTGIGTSRWLAPEVMAGGGTYDQSCDIYSLGIVISELDTHRLPFAGLRMASGNPMPEMSILQLVSAGQLQPTFRPSCPERLRDIALKCVAFDPKDRPSAIEVSYVLRTIAKQVFGM